MHRLICINGSPRRASRTAVLVDAMAEEIAARLPVERLDVRLAVDGPQIFSGTAREHLSPAGEVVCRTVESADLLVVGSPVYRASYTGLLKHLFDLVDREALQGCKAVLVASGGSPHHGLVIEHQLRPLMGFFGVLCAATGIYALEDDIVGERLVGIGQMRRIQRAAAEIADLSMHARPRGLPAAVAAAWP